MAIKITHPFAYDGIHHDNAWCNHLFLLIMLSQFVAVSEV